METSALLIAGLAHADQLHPQSFHGETGQVTHARERLGIELSREVADLTAGEAACVRVGVGAAVVASRAVAVGELGGKAAADEGLEGLVDGGERDIGDHPADGREDVVCRRVLVGLAQEPVDSGPLLGEALATGLECLSKQGIGIVPVLCLNVHWLRRVVLRGIRQ